MKNKKIILETIIIPLCVLYLAYTLLNNHITLTKVISYITLFITSLELSIKNLKEVYVYEYKYNYLKTVLGIFNIILILIMGLNIVYKNSILNATLLIGIAVLIIYQISYAVANIIKISKNEKEVYKYVLRAFLSLISSAVLLGTLIIMI